MRTLFYFFLRIRRISGAALQSSGLRVGCLKSLVRWNKCDSNVYVKAAVVIREQIKASTRGGRHREASFHFKL